MKQLSSKCHPVFLPQLLILSVFVFAGGCYSFTGGSIPPHLKTLHIQTVDDQSGFGNPEYATFLTQELIRQFENDGSFTLVQQNADATLSTVIRAVRDEVLTVQTGEQEQDRKVTVVVEAEYWDRVRKKQIWKKTFTQYRVYPVAGGAQARDQVAQEALAAIAEDILLAVISHW